MGEIVDFSPHERYVPPTGQVAPVSGVIEGAKQANLTRVVIAGYTEDGEMYVAGSHCCELTLGLLARATHKVAAFPAADLIEQ